MATIVHQADTMGDGAGIGFFIGVTVLLLALALFFLVGLPYVSDSRTNTTIIERESRVEVPVPDVDVVPERGAEPDRGEPATLPY